MKNRHMTPRYAFWFCLTFVQVLLVTAATKIQIARRKAQHPARKGTR
jgi:hypothetical protein